MRVHTGCRSTHPDDRVEDLHARLLARLLGPQKVLVAHWQRKLYVGGESGS